ncbi:MAG TPA: HAD family hydrolase [Herpetosiphonaceae bacterium]|nr:HAD family hydrolase [Herpetosiphonaceae bacterium]
MATDLIFDFFGTLVQYQAGRFHGEPYRRTHGYLAGLGVDLPYDQFAARFAAAFDELESESKRTHSEFHMREVGRRFLNELDIRFSLPELDRFIDLYCAEWDRGTLHLDGIAALLERLAARYRLSIISNTHYPPLLHRNLAAMGVAGRFAQVVTSVEVGTRKPHPAIFRHALDALGLQPDAAIYVGDSYADDWAGARAAGLRCILIDPAGQHRDAAGWRVGSLFELEDFPLLRP